MNYNSTYPCELQVLKVAVGCMAAEARTLVRVHMLQLTRCVGSELPGLHQGVLEIGLNQRSFRRHSDTPNAQRVLDIIEHVAAHCRAHQNDFVVDSHGVGSW
eukprot:6292970-Amphidinium_carterae.1